jgi:hypothetical protein
MIKGKMRRKAPDISWVRVRPEDFPLTNPLIKNSGWFVMGILHSSRIVSPIFHARALKGNTTTVFLHTDHHSAGAESPVSVDKIGIFGVGSS